MRILVLICSAAVVLFTIFVLERPPVLLSSYTYINFLVQDGEGKEEPVSLSIGVARSCTGAPDECALDNVVELLVGGRKVASIPASTLTAWQEKYLKEAFQSTIDRTKQTCSPPSPSPLLPAKPVFIERRERTAEASLR